LRTGNRNEDDS